MSQNSLLVARCSLLVALADRKSFLLRIDPAVLQAVQRWADEELRSLNGQIEWILRWALQEARRGKIKESLAPRRDADADVDEPRSGE
jgi:hypothetical protein